LSSQLSKARILKLNKEQTWKTSKIIFECNKDSARGNIIKATKDFGVLWQQKPLQIHKKSTK
jgi:hypothetical protein